MKDSGVIHCKNCGANVLKGIGRCPVCRAKIPSNSFRAVKNENYSFKQEELVAKEEKKCIRCEYILDDDCNFCPNCGLKVVKENDDKDSENSSDVVFAVLYIAILLSTLVVGPLSFVASFIIAITGKIVCPNSKITMVIFWIAISIFVFALILFVFVIDTIRTCPFR